MIPGDFVSPREAAALLQMKYDRDGAAARDRVVATLRELPTYVITGNGGVVEQQIGRKPTAEEIDWRQDDVEAERLGLDDLYDGTVPLRLRRSDVVAWRRERYSEEEVLPAPARLEMTLTSVTAAPEQAAAVLLKAVIPIPDPVEVVAAAKPVIESAPTKPKRSGGRPVTVSDQVKAWYNNDLPEEERQKSANALAESYKAETPALPGEKDYVRKVISELQKAG